MTARERMRLLAASFVVLPVLSGLAYEAHGGVKIGLVVLVVMVALALFGLVIEL